MAPEYALWGHLSYKVDVYSFGIVILEIVSGRSNSSYVPNDDFFCLLDWVYIFNLLNNIHHFIISMPSSSFHRFVVGMFNGPGPHFEPLSGMVLEGLCKDRVKNWLYYNLKEAGYKRAQ